MILTTEERMTIAKMVKPIWVADRENAEAKGTDPEAMDRSIALGMLTSNLQHEERENKKMLYDCGTLTPDELAEGKKIWAKVPQYMRGVEHKLILDVVNELEW